MSFKNYLEKEGNTLDQYKTKRDDLIQQLLLILDDLSHSQTMDDFTSEDLDLWSSIIKHSAIQGKLKHK